VQVCLSFHILTPHVATHGEWITEDLPLWIETDGAVQWCQEWLRCNEYVLPDLPAILKLTGPELNGQPLLVIGDSHSISVAELEAIYSDMLLTSFEIIADSSSK